MSICLADFADCSRLVSLINSAYRGENSKRGWTTEAAIIGGQYRILQPQLEELMKKPGAVFLKSINEKEEPDGTVYLEKTGDQLYLGMLTVAPGVQGKGTGHQLLLAAEAFAREQHCRSIFMRVIHLRQELVEWYRRRGYYDTGRTEAFTPSADAVVLQPFHFIILEKVIPALP